MLDSISLLGVKVTVSPKTKILEILSSYLISNTQNVGPLTIFTPNPEQIVLANEKKDYRELLNTADIALPDGAGVVWASKLVGSGQSAVHRKLLPTANYKLRTLERIPGIEFMEELVKLAADRGYQVVLVGGRDGVGQRALNELKKTYPRLNGWVEEGEEFGIMNKESRIKEKQNSKDPMIHNSIFLIQQPEDTDTYFKNLAMRLIKSGTKVVFVGLGAPKQEYFIAELSKQFTVHSSQLRKINKKTTANYPLPTVNSLVLMSVGGAFDIISGKIPRAPKLVRELQLEWLWRLIIEPRRIYRQQKLLKFLVLTLRTRFMLR